MLSDTLPSTSPAPPQPASRVTQATIESAVTALLHQKEAQSKTQKPQLLPLDEFLYLTLTLHKIPPEQISRRTNPYKIPLPHPLHQPSSAESCLIVDDRPNSGLTSAGAKEKIKTENIPVTKVLKLSKLKTDYKPFEAKRKLCNSYDLFFVDKRAVPLLPKLLGKEFFKKKKLPLLVDLTHKNWREQIERAGSACLLYLRGTCSVVKVGRLSMEVGEVVENVLMGIDGVVGLVPGGWGGVRSVHLKLRDSVALPVYQAVPEMRLKIRGIERSVEENGGGAVVKVKGEGKVGKRKRERGKKGRIHEVEYMDASVGDEEMRGNVDGEVENVENESDHDFGGVELVGKKRKGVKGRVLGELDGEKVAKVETGSDDEDEDVTKKKKRRERDSEKGEKRAKKMSKKGEEKRGGLTLEDTEESGGKKRKKKGDRGIMLKDAAVDAKVKRSKKKRSVD
ncbi:hypothetical protein RJ640_008835 [Escallonia rubra]|uniref:Ribosomal protein L1 n=1 Tax=Escallonia rubra TaxID=112253 RepID=A0AA88S1P2_9ASTE|nr:hypothetical protein RJ640_008835 [Escallonia rubra]